MKKCLYVHGPIHGLFYNDRNKKYLNAINDLIPSTGIVMISMVPYCISNYVVGDHPKHMSPQYEILTTKYYANLLLAYDEHITKINSLQSNGE